MFKIALYFLGFCALIGVVIVGSNPVQNRAPSAPLRASLGEGSICLNMIVKNEREVIEKCLASVKGLIDYWVIVDTGSTDGTQRVIKECMKDIPGELHERPWVNFEHNRNEALALAKNKADYSFFIDADEKLVFLGDFVKPKLDRDQYYMDIRQVDSSNYPRKCLVKNALDWKWKGVIHEVIDCDQVKTEGFLTGVYNHSDSSLGARSKNPKKYIHDAEILEAELKKDPEDTRNRFYLAMAYANANEYYLALENYKKRALGEGNKDEVFYSLLRVARLKEIFGMPSDIVVKSYLTAHEYNRSRPEPLYYLGIYYMRAQKYDLAYKVFKQVDQINPLDSIYGLFLEKDIFDWRLLGVLAETCNHLGKYRELEQIFERVLLENRAPKNLIDDAHRNLPILKEM